ncbi:MAG: hypothetical protein KBT05_07045 [Bacteroidales bacterium]|nr:hypothetical protein [Candidatus Cryptobacteroides caccocaballi]
MKKFIICSAMAFAALAANAQPGFMRMPAPDPDPYTLEVGKLTMVVDAGQGAKVMSFKYDGKEVMSELKGFNQFGSTFWTSPQAEWNWPPVAEYDRLPYTVEKQGDALVMTSKLSEKYQYQIKKTFKTDASDNSIAITYSIINRADKARQVAPWEITRVPGNGLIFFEAAPKSIEAAQGELIPFVSKYGAAWYAFDEKPANRKTNADGKGWLAYANNGLLFVKEFPDIISTQPAPGEAEIQVYVNEGKTFIEIESQGAYTTLQPGQALEYTVKWHLVPADSKDVPSKKLLKLAKKITK